MSAMVEPVSQPQAPRRGVTLRWITYFGLAAAVVIADQISKAWVNATFNWAYVHGAPGAADGPTEVLGSFVRIAKTQNTGGIFGLFGSSALLLGLASIVVIAFILVYEAREGIRAHPLLTIALGLLTGGAVGNLIDRLHFGYVIDWVDTGLGDTRWYTFNVADAAISCSIVGLLLIGLMGERLARSGPQPVPDEPAADPGVTR